MASVFTNLEAGKNYELKFDITPDAQKDNILMGKILTVLQQNSLKLSDKLHIIKTSFLPNFANRKQLILTVETYPAPQTLSTNFAVVPLIVISIVVLSGFLLANKLLNFLKLIDVKEVPKVIGNITSIVKLIGVAVAIIFIFPYIKTFLPKGKN